MSLLDTIFSARLIKGSVEFIQRKSIEFIGDGVTIADDPVSKRTKITIAAGGGALPLHAAEHIFSGDDVIDGNRLWVTYTPNNYTRQLVPDETDDLAELTSNLRGIDSALGTLRKINYVSEGGTSHAFVIGDAYTSILCSSNSGVGLALPSNATVPYEVGTVLTFIPMGTGQLTFSAGAGATLVSGGNELKSLRQYGPVFAQKTGTNAWLLSGEKVA